MKETGFKTKHMDMESTRMLTEHSTKENGRRINKTGMESNLGLTRHATKDTIVVARNRA